MKIAFVLTAKYPTEKAYGVTTRKTVEALQKQGHEVSVISVKSTYQDTDYEKSEVRLISIGENCFSVQVRKRFLNNTKILNRIAFKVVTNLYLRRVSKVILKENFDIIWTRESFTIFGLRKVCRDRRNVLELHSLPRYKITKKIIRYFENSIVFAPINSSIKLEFDSFGFVANSLIAPMSIDEKLVATAEELQDYIQRVQMKAESGELIVGYVGKFRPNGYSKGVEDVLNVARYAQKCGIPGKFMLVGGLTSEINQITSNREYNLPNLEIVGHVNHSKAIEFMKLIDIHVIPEPESEIYFGTPLKLREIMALGRIIVAADCLLLRNFFSNEYQPIWYEAKNEESLLKAIKALDDPNTLKSNLILGISEVSDFTWHHRSLRVVNYLDGLRKNLSA